MWDQQLAMRAIKEVCYCCHSPKLGPLGDANREFAVVEDGNTVFIGGEDRYLT